LAVSSSGLKVEMGHDEGQDEGEKGRGIDAAQSLASDTPQGKGAEEEKGKGVPPFPWGVTSPLPLPPEKDQKCILCLEIVREKSRGKKAKVAHMLEDSMLAEWPCWAAKLYKKATSAIAGEKCQPVIGDGLDKSHLPPLHVECADLINGGTVPEKISFHNQHVQKLVASENENGEKKDSSPGASQQELRIGCVIAKDFGTSMGIFFGEISDTFMEGEATWYFFSISFIMCKLALILSSFSSKIKVSREL
jgi:hypothetical protein